MKIEALTAILDLITEIILMYGNMRITEYVSWGLFLVSMALAILVVRWVYREWTD